MKRREPPARGPRAAGPASSAWPWRSCWAWRPSWCWPPSRSTSVPAAGRDPTVWADYPKAVPPAWTAAFAAARPARAPHPRGHRAERVDRARRGPRGHLRPALHLRRGRGAHLPLLQPRARCRYQDRPPALSLVLQRPDGTEVTLLRSSARGPRPGEEPPFVRNDETPLRVLVSAEPETAEAIADALRRGLRRGRAASSQIAADVSAALFGVPDADGDHRAAPRRLHGAGAGGAGRPGRHARLGAARRRRLRLRPAGHGRQRPRPGGGAGLRAARGAAHRPRRGDREHGHRHRPGPALGLQGRPRRPASSSARPTSSTTCRCCRCSSSSSSSSARSCGSSCCCWWPSAGRASPSWCARWCWASPAARRWRRPGPWVPPRSHILRRHIFPHTAPYVFTQLIFFVPAVDPGRGRPLVPGPGRPVAADVGPDRSRTASAPAPSSWATGGGSSRLACSSSSRP